MRNSKKLVTLLMTVGLCVAIFRFGMVAGAASQTPGSSQDPLITQSYLELRLEDLNQPNRDNYKKVSVSKGKSITIDDGGEFIIYSGEAIVIGNKGVINLTQGSLDEKDNKTVKYHQYLSLSSDSGINATVSCILYVKGNYTIR